MLRWLFDDSPFLPRSGCAISGDFPAWLKWELALGGIGIWACYVLIPAAILIAWRRERARLEAEGTELEVPKPMLELAPWFMAFILACGLSHLLDATMFWWPRYRLLGAVVAITFLASAGTLAKLSRVLVHYLRATAAQEAAEQRAATAEARAAREAQRARRIEAELQAARAASEDLKVKLREFCLQRGSEE